MANPRKPVGLPGTERVAVTVFRCSCGAQRMARGYQFVGVLGGWRAAHNAVCPGGRHLEGQYQTVRLWVVRPPLGGFEVGP